MRFNRVFARFFCRMRAAKICVVWGAAMRRSTFWFPVGDAAASVLTLFAASMIAGACNGQVTGGLQPTDYQRMRSVAQAEFSPDGKFIAYTVVRYDRPGRPWPQLWVMDVA